MIIVQSKQYFFLNFGLLETNSYLNAVNRILHPYFVKLFLSY